MKTALASLRWVLLPSILSVTSAAQTGEGNVRAFVDNDGVLVVLGDGLDNSVFVGRTGIPGEFRVVGEFGTTVNRQTSEVLLANSVTILMRGGNDRVRVDGNIPGDVEVDGGAGNDFLTLGDPAIEGSALLSGGAGDDVVTAGDTFVRGELRMRGGAGNDTVSIEFTFVLDRVVMESGSGNDQISTFQSDVSGFLRIDASSGDDTVQMNTTGVSDAVVLDLGGGQDSVDLSENELGDRLTVALGSSDDGVRIGLTQVQGEASFLGGSGQDEFTDAGGNDFVAGPPHVSGFE